MTTYLSFSKHFDFKHPVVQQYLDSRTDPTQTLEEKAVALFYAVRDDIRYDPFRIDFGKEAMIASNILERGKGHCMDKAVVIGAVYRALNLPTRIGLAKVKNHIATEKLETFLGSNVLAPHGYVEVYLNERWCKVNTVLNK